MKAGDQQRFQDALDLCRRLNEAGYPTKLAGGCVRDRLLGKTPKDYDLATTMAPRACLSFFKRAGFGTIPLGLDHGTVGVITPLQQVEVTTLRRDAHCDGRHAKVIFDADFKSDAERRDFTINALFEDVAGKVHDFVGGLADLEARRLRFVGDPGARIREDYLRILRYYRFLGRYGWSAEADQEAAVQANTAGLRQLSAERVHGEMDQILGSSHAAKLLALMNQTGVLTTLFPWYDPAQTQTTGALLAAVGGDDAVIHWFTLLFLGGARKLDNLKTELDRLRFTRADRKWLLSAFTIMAGLTGDLDAVLTQALVLGESQPKRLRHFHTWLTHYGRLKGPEPPHAVINLLQGMATLSPPHIPSDQLNALPPRERGETARLVKIYWYLGLCHAKSDLGEIMEQRHTFRLRLRTSDIKSFSPRE